jgi:DNA-binding CsgD family transcriptional regulator
VTIVLSGGTEVTVRGEPIRDGGTPAGVILRIAARGGRGGRAPDRGHPRWGWESLTDTERSVTNLVTQGLTNQEAAQRLYMSRHTVGFHLRSIFRKLDVNSRVDLTRLVAQLDAAPPAPARP